MILRFKDGQRFEFVKERGKLKDERLQKQGKNVVLKPKTRKGIGLIDKIHMAKIIWADNIIDKVQCDSEKDNELV